MLNVNADDLGIESLVTDRIISCYQQKRINSASFMTFMKDSERAAYLACKIGMNIGIHLNFDQELTGKNLNDNLLIHHKAISGYLKKGKWNQVIYNRSLKNSFKYVYNAQWNEYLRLIGEEPKRLDGHHHMHLCMNMLVSGNYHRGIKIRRNFSFKPGEKDPFNRFYRYLVDRWLKLRYQCMDYFFSLAPIDQKRLKRIIVLSTTCDVELMVHPGVQKEFQFLNSDEWVRMLYS